MLTKMERIDDSNRDYILGQLEQNLVENVFAEYALRYDREHTEGYAIFKKSILEGYVLTYDGIDDIQRVYLESHEAEATKQLVKHAPSDHFIMHAHAPNFLDVVRNWPSANYFLEDWMLVKKGETETFTSNLVRKLKTKEDALQLMKLHAPPNLFSVVRNWRSADNYFQSLMLVKQGKTKALVSDIVGKLKTAEWKTQLARLLHMRKESSERTVRKYEKWLVKMKIYGVFVEGRLIGYAASPIQTPKAWVIEGVFTHPEFRNNGYSTFANSALTEEALRNSESATLFVRSDNLPAIRVYKKIGYRKIGEMLYVDVGTSL